MPFGRDVDEVCSRCGLLRSQHTTEISVRNALTGETERQVIVRAQVRDRFGDLRPKTVCVGFVPSARYKRRR